MMPPLALIIAAINAGVSIIPEGAKLIASLKTLFNENDQAKIEAALLASAARADAQHAEAQSL